MRRTVKLVFSSHTQHASIGILTLTILAFKSHQNSGIFPSHSRMTSFLSQNLVFFNVFYHFPCITRFPLKWLQIGKHAYFSLKKPAQCEQPPSCTTSKIATPCTGIYKYTSFRYQKNIAMSTVELTSSHLPASDC